MIARIDDIPTGRFCPACEHRDCRALWSLNLPAHPIPFDLWRCCRCGAVFNHPMLHTDAVREQYDGDYYVFNEPPARRWGRATQLYLEHLLPLESRFGGQRLLEIGCAGGELLALARERGWRVTGVEISSQAANHAANEHGLDVRVGTIEQHAPALGTFDVTIANDVIEHVPSPRSFLTLLRRLVRPGGWISVETPNWGSRWRRLGGASWLGINRFHIVLFDARSLIRLMGECGWRDCKAGTSTNLAYTSWACRPELKRLLDRLPPGLRWRAERWADFLTPTSPALALHRNPPLDLRQAADHIATVDPFGAGVSSSLSGDNLTVIGRA